MYEKVTTISTVISIEKDIIFISCILKENSKETKKED
jgi:hypothetical protein